MSDSSLFDLSPDEVRDLEDKSKGKLGSLSKTSRLIKDEIFKILADNSLFIQYPIEDDELCGFVCRKRGRTFSFVNSYIPYEKQIFAAAHELYHIWFDDSVLIDGELLKSNVLEPLGAEQLNVMEAKANRFSAMFLVPKDVLQIELGNLGLVSSEELHPGHIVKIMDMFAVPYKTIVRRLYEINFIKREFCKELLSVPDRDEKSGVRLVQKRLQIGNDWQSRPKTIRFDGLIDNALSAYEQKKITEKKLCYLLSIARTMPEEFGISISDRLPTEEELLDLLEN